MPRMRRSSLSSEFPTDQPDSPQPQPVEADERSLQDPAKFFRAIVEIERVRGLRVHPESPTRH
jgi:hypothetical protein